MILPSVPVVDSVFTHLRATSSPSMSAMAFTIWIWLLPPIVISMLFCTSFSLRTLPRNPEIVDEEFFFDPITGPALTDDPLLSDLRRARDPRDDAYGNLQLHLTSRHDQDCDFFDCYVPSPSYTVSRLERCLDYLAIFGSFLKRRLPDLDALKPNFGWSLNNASGIHLTKQHNITKLRHVYLCVGTTSLASLAATSRAFPNGTPSTLCFSLHLPLMMESPAMFVTKDLTTMIIFTIAYLRPKC